MFENAMTPQQIVGLFVRLYAVWLATSAIQVFGIGMALLGKTQEYTLVPYGIAAVMLVTAVLLWFFPMLVAHKLIPRTQYENVLKIPALEAAVVACIAVGLWVFVARALPSLAQYLSVAAVFLKSHQPLSAMGETQFNHLVEGLLELAVAAFLTFKAHAVATYLLISRQPNSDD